jgi:hypothetical protein
LEMFLEITLFGDIAQNEGEEGFIILGEGGD